MGGRARRGLSDRFATRRALVTDTDDDTEQ
jgi:hypothetical protein